LALRETAEELRGWQDRVRIQGGVAKPSLTVLVKARHYAHFFKQEVSLDEGSAGV
jgi:hypothetical protein